MKARLLEETNDLQATVGYVEQVLTTDCPELLEAMVFLIEFYLRHDQRDLAEEKIEQFTNEGGSMLRI